MTKENKTVEITIVQGAEGIGLYINHYRVCGIKPWGGGKVIHNWKDIPVKEILDALENFISSNKKKPDGNHHEYCIHTYQNKQGDWRCSCDLLRAYDEWRRILEDNIR